MTVKVSKDDVGFYTTKKGATPDFDPGVRPCLLCGLQWTKGNVRTYSIRGDDTKSLFWRAHQTCGEKASPEEITAVDMAVLSVMGISLKNPTVV